MMIQGEAIKIDWNTPREILEREAEKDNPEALLYLGKLYQFGHRRGYTIDEEKASELFQRGSRLADQGAPAAQCCRAACYNNGYGVVRDKKEAIKWLRKAVKQEYAPAYAQLGLCCQRVGNIEKNDVEAVKWFRKATEQGDSIGLYELAFHYFNGNGVDQDNQEAVRLLHQAADLGNLKAQCHLGTCYACGIGVEKDKEQMIKWYRIAAENGLAEAQLELSRYYYDGDCVAEDKVEAFNWMRKAAEQGHERAQYELGICYEYGDGTDKDDKEAVVWYRKAAEQGNTCSEYSLGRCYRNGVGVRADKLEAIRWFSKCAWYFAEAQVELDYLYLEGDEDSRNLIEASEWLQEATEQEHEAVLAVREALNHIETYKTGSFTKIREAAKQGYRPATKILGLDDLEKSPLHVAAILEDVVTLEKLIREGADLEVEDNHSETPLICAAEFGCLESCRLLLEAGATVNASAVLRLTTFSVIWGWHQEVCKMLLKSGADINALDCRNRTPLHWAAKHGLLEAVEFLLAHGARTDLKDNDGKLPIDVADSEEKKRILHEAMGISPAIVP